MATPWRGQIDYITDGEPVSAGVTNRPVRELADNINYLKDRVDQAATEAADVLYQVVVRTDVAPGTPVFYNHLTAQYEPAQAVDGQDAVVGICLMKPYGVANLADLLLNGTVALDITPVLDIGVSLATGRYFLSASAPGKLTTTRPADIQVAVLIADGAGRVFVMPQDRAIGGARGPQGYLGYQGTHGYQGVTGGIGPQGAAGPAVSMTEPAASATTDSNVELFLLTSAGGLLFAGTVRNLSVANSMIVREEVTDAFGVSAAVETTLVPSSARVLAANGTLSTAHPPFVSYRVLVRSAQTGTPAGYLAKLSHTP